MPVMTKSKSVLMCVAILGGGLLAAIGFSLIKPSPKVRPPEELIRTLPAAKAEACPERPEIKGHGTALPVKTVTVSAEIKGCVESLPSGNRAGRIVKDNETVAKIESDDYALALKEAEAELARLKAEDASAEQFIRDTEEELSELKRELELEELDFARSKSLFEKGVRNHAEYEKSEQSLIQKRRQHISLRSGLEKAKIQLGVLSAQITKAEALRDKAALDLRRCTIGSPFAGRIDACYVDEGEFVSPGQRMFDIADDSELEIRVPLDAFEATKTLGLRPGKKGASVNWLEAPYDIDALIEWTEFPDGFHWKGSLDRIEKFDSDTRTLVVVVKPLKDEGESDGRILVSGMFCKVSLFGKRIPGAISIPWSAIQHDDDVFVIGADGRLSSRTVKIFGSSGENVIVASGVEDGELVVSQQAPRGSVDGMKVKAALRDAPR